MSVDPKASEDFVKDSPDKDGPNEEKKELKTKPSMAGRRASVVGELSAQQKETAKAKLAKMKQVRAERAGRLHGIYRSVIEMVAFYLNEEDHFVEEGILDSEQHVKILENFFTPGGPQAVILNCSDRPLPPQESGRFFPGLSKDTLMKRVIVSDCSDIDLTGTSVLVRRNSESRNSAEELLYSSFQVDEEIPTILGSTYFIHDLITRPQLHRTTAWGTMLKAPNGPENKKNFLDDFNDYVHFLKMTKSDLDGAVKFESDESLFKSLDDPDKIMEHLNDGTVVDQVETIVRSWLKKIEWVLTQSEQLRSERPDIDPDAEIEYWRKLLAKFASIVEHCKTPECVSYITYLVQIHSKLIKKWKFFDNWVTFSENEASDNVRHLYALQQYLQPLYRMTPEAMTNYLPSLIFSIRLTYAMSRYMKTAERITTLLVKVTNQMLTTCIQYLTNNNTKTVWQQKKNDFMQKMCVCLRLYKRYHDVYTDPKYRIDDIEGEYNLEASEMFVFGKFKTFKTRLYKLRDVLKTTLMYSILENSKLEGIDVHAAKFKQIYSTISSKTYDALNHRKPEFDIDYDIFKNSILAAESELRQFKEATLAASPDVLNRLMLIKSPGSGVGE